MIFVTSFGTQRIIENIKQQLAFFFCFPIFIAAVSHFGFCLLTFSVDDDDDVGTKNTGTETIDTQNSTIPKDDRKTKDTTFTTKQQRHDGTFAYERLLMHHAWIVE